MRSGTRTRGAVAVLLLLSGCGRLIPDAPKPTPYYPPSMSRPGQTSYASATGVIGQPIDGDLVEIWVDGGGCVGEIRLRDVIPLKAHGAD